MLKSRVVRTFSTSVSKMAAAAGSKFPSVTLFENTPGGAVKSEELFASGKSIIFGVPGAFTPGCTKTHLPGYVANAEKFKAKGVKEIVCVSVNDPFVMAEWGKAYGADKAGIRMLADTNAELTKALGVPVAEGVQKALGGVRCQRFSAIVEDGVIKSFNVEPDGTGLTCSLADPLMKQLA